MRIKLHEAGNMQPPLDPTPMPSAPFSISLFCGLFLPLALNFTPKGRQRRQQQYFALVTEIIIQWSRYGFFYYQQLSDLLAFKVKLKPKPLHLAFALTLGSWELIRRQIALGPWHTWWPSRLACLECIWNACHYASECSNIIQSILDTSQSNTNNLFPIWIRDQNHNSSHV